MNIPEAAVEAAALAWCGRADLRDWQRRHITKLLEAAASHMLGIVWADAYGAGFQEGAGFGPTANPYGVNA